MTRTVAILVRAVLAGAAGMVAAGCGALWGFEDPVPRRDAAPQAVADTGQDGAGSPSCACAPAVPEPWQGPFELFESAATPPEAPPDCGGAYPFVRFDGVASPDPGPQTCGCACGVATNVLCSPVAKLFSDNQCKKACGPNGTPASVPIGATCTALGNGPCGGGVHETIGAPAASGGECQPEATVDTAALRPTRRARLCGATADGGAEATAIPAACDAGTRCAPAPESGFETGAFCIVGAASSPCPADYGFKRPSYYETSTDTRKCGSCQCSAPTGVCSDSASTYMDMGMGMGMGCTGAPTMVSLPSDCIAAASGRYSATIPTSASCSPIAGAPIGAPPPPTICCTQP